MSDNGLIVPIVLTTGTLHFASVKQDCTAQDVIDSLVALDEVTSDTLGDLEETGWALQKIRREESGRMWEEDELEAIGDGIIPPSTLVAPLLDIIPASPISPSMGRHFSTYPLTSHLHKPTLRLVSLHPLLLLTVAFCRIPQVHDGYERGLFISRDTTVETAMESVVKELGLSRNLPFLGSGNFEYVLEEVWTEGNSEKSSELPLLTVVSNVIETPFASNPFNSSARRTFRFCIPDEWFRRSKTRHANPASLASSELTIKRLADMETSDSDDSTDGEGTAKQQKLIQTPRLHDERRDSPDWRNSFSKSRLPNLFDGWLSNAPSTSPKRASITSLPERLIVSEPKLVEHPTGSSGAESDCGDSENIEIEEPDAAEFEQMLDEMGLKGSKREAMYKLRPDHKRYLLQNQDFRSNSSTARASSFKASGHFASSPSHSATYGPSSAVSTLPLFPQLTGGGGFIKRFSITGWGAAAQPIVSDNTERSELDIGGGSPRGKVGAQVEGVAETMAPLQLQGTGGLWSSWWTSSGGAGGDKDLDKDTSKSARWYVQGIRGVKMADSKLVKHLISLRVHLSTAKLVWIEEFLVEAKGMDALATVLASLVGKGDKRKKFTDVESTVLLEVIRCLRVLLNTKLGFDEVLAFSTIITHITYSLQSPSMRLRTLALELLAAISVLSVEQGHKAVLAAMSDYRIVYEESFRFESLIGSLRLHDFDVDIVHEEESKFRHEEEGLWEARTASMTLVNALTNCPESLEERILLRDEFGRRGLNEVIVALRYIKPPDSLLTQLDLYTEEKFEDEEDMRERSRNLMNRASGHQRARSDSEVVLEDLIRLARQHGELYPVMVDILKRYELLLQRDVGVQLKADLFTILDQFVAQAALLNDFDDSWHLFMMRFANSVQHITGQELEVKAASDSDSMTVVEQEMDGLRTKVEELSDERTELRNQLNQQIAEMNTYKSLPLNLPVPHSKAPGKGGNENFHGLVQRLVQKEKQVLQLQAELDRFNAQNPAEARDADERAKRDRDRAKWHTLMDEIAKLKSKNGECEVSMSIKDKEIVYLKRALESVYNRFQSREEIREANFDAQLIASRTIERLTQKDNEISSLTSEVTALKAQLAAKPKFVTERDFKAQIAPPPPPVKPKRAITHSPLTSEPPDLAIPIPSSRPLPPPRPPPPPPTALLPAVPSVIPLTAPPPPPPPPPSPTLPALEKDHNAFTPAPPPPPPPAVGGSLGPSLPPPPPLNSMGSPPPPPSIFIMGSRPNASRPAKRLKPFFWNKVGNTDVASTVWNDVPSGITFNMEDLEVTFTIDNTPPASSQILSPTRKQTVTTLLDISRANNIAIMLSRIKLGYPEIRMALLDIDDRRLSIDDLIAISKQLPTLEEIERIKDFGDVNKLAKADQYFGQIMTIPRLSERLECMIYRRKLDLEIEEIRPELNILRNASHEARHSGKFKQVLQAILTLGNALNGSNFRGGARGFQLEALLKMKETKTAKGGPECPTLLHYLARVLLRTDPSLVTFIEDMPHLEAAARVSVQIIVQSVNSLAAGLQQVNDEMRHLQKRHTLSADDRFVQVMQPFTAHVSDSVDALKKMSASLESEIRSLLVYYGEQPNFSEGNKPEDFFGLILSFSSALQKSAVEVHDVEDRSLAAIGTSLVSEQPKEATPDPTIKESSQSLPPPLMNSRGRAGGHQTIHRGDLDQVIRSMKDGKRRARPNRPLSKIFLDGGKSQS